MVRWWLWCGGSAAGVIPHSIGWCLSSLIDCQSIVVVQRLEQLISSGEHQSLDVVVLVQLGVDSCNFDEVVLLGKFSGQAVYLLREPSL